MIKKVVTLLGYCGVAMVAFKLGVLTECDRKKDVTQESRYISAVPMEYQEEAEKACMKVAEVTGDEVSDIDIKSMFKLADKRVYFVDSDFKAFAVIITDDGKVDVSDAEFDFD